MINNKIIININNKIKSIKFYIKKLFKEIFGIKQEKRKHYIPRENQTVKTLDECLEDFDSEYDNYFKQIIKKYDPNKKNIVIIDDSEGMVSVFNDYLQIINANGKINLAEYNIFSFYGEYTPFLLMRFINKYSIKKIDLAVIDIILPGRIRCEGATFKRDGIDVSIFLNKKCECKNFLFYTGNVITKDVKFISEKIEKYENYFGSELENKIIYKDYSDELIEEKIIKLFNGEIHV